LPGISFGNNQDAVLNSSLNLQLNVAILAIVFCHLQGRHYRIFPFNLDGKIPAEPAGFWIRYISRPGKKADGRANFGDIDIRPG